MRSAAFFPAIAARRAGTQLAIQASPWATEQECMLWQSFGVSQMKFVPASQAEITSFEESGSRLAHREAFPLLLVERPVDNKDDDEEIEGVLGVHRGVTGRSDKIEDAEWKDPRAGEGDEEEHGRSNGANQLVRP